MAFGDLRRNPLELTLADLKRIIKEQFDIVI